MIEQVTLDLLQVAMDMKQVQHKAAAANVASANVPGSTKLEVDFSSLLSRLESADPQTRSAIIDSVKQNWSGEVDSATQKLLSEQVKLDEESAQLLLASGKYRLMAESVSRKLGLMSVAVSGGKR